MKKYFNKDYYRYTMNRVLPQGKILILLTVILLILISISGYLVVLNESDNDDDDEEDELEFEMENIRIQGSPQNTNEVSIAVNPVDPLNIVAGANDYSTPNNDAWCGYYWSRDGGKTWDQGLLPGYNGDISVQGLSSPLFGYSGTGDPVLAFDSQGNLYYAGIAFTRTFAGRSAIFVAKSVDGGETWRSSDIRIVAQGDGITMFHDKEWLIVDLANDNVYIAWASFHALSFATIFFSRSTDGGDSWSFWEVASNYAETQFDNQGTYLGIDSESTIHLIWIDFGVNQIQYVYSRDLGNSFSTPVSIADVRPIDYQLEHNSYRTPTLPQLAIDPGEGEFKDSIYVSWNDQSNGDADILLIYSRDGGDSWSEPVRVNQDEPGNGKDQFFPGLSVSPDGIVSIHFYDRRDDANNTMLNIYYAVSDDGGLTFKDSRLSDTSFDGNAGGGSWIGQNTGGDAFIGDYHTSASTEDRVYYIWCDTRNGDPDNRNSDVYMAYVNL